MSTGAAMALAFNINEQTLNALQIAAKFSPVLSVAIAAGVALSILEVVQGVKVNKQNFAAIARDSCFIVEIVIQRIQVDQNGQTLNDPVFRRHTDLLVVDLRYIERRIKKVKTWSAVRKIFSNQLHQATIQDCRERLTHAMVLFDSQDDFEIHRQLTSASILLTMMLRVLSHPPLSQMQPQPLWRSTLPPRTHGPSTSSVRYDRSLNTPAPTPVPAPMTSPLQPQESPERAERQPAQDQIGMRGIAQQWVNVAPSCPTGSPARLGLNDTQNNASPGAQHTYVAGDVNDIRRDDSFNVFGTGNHIYFSFAR